MGEGQVMAKGWFSTPGRPGDRTLKDQMKGLDWVFENCAGKSILDAGCAEGLLSIELMRRGARGVHGVDVVDDHIRIAKLEAARAGLYEATLLFFQAADANTWAPQMRYDIVLLLAVLHKLKNPSEVAKRMAHAAKEHVIVRLPPKYAPFVIDERSKNEPHNITDAMIKAGFYLEDFTFDGHFGEWVGRYKRIRDV